MHRLGSILPFATALLALLLGCGKAAGTNPDLAVGRHSFSTADGSTMPYEVGGNPEAETAVVLVHGWMSNRSFWEAQLPVLAEHYRTVSLDLPGHGEASNDREAWTIAAYGEDIAGLIENLDLRSVVLVGHSMGGPVSLYAANLAGGRVLGIVAVDSLQDVSFLIDDELVERTVSGFEDDFVVTCESFIGGFFLGHESPDIKERVVRESCEAKRAAAGAALIRSYLETDFPSVLRSAGVPVRAINASAMNPTNIEANRNYADFDAVLMDGVGHFLHMTRPEEFNERLLDTIAAIVGR